MRVNKSLSILVPVLPLPFQLLKAFGRIARYAGLIGVIHTEFEQPVCKLLQLLKLDGTAAGISLLLAKFG